jgi:hypothetical protein
LPYLITYLSFAKKNNIKNVKKQIYTENKTWYIPCLILFLLIGLFPILTQAQLFIEETEEDVVIQIEDIYIGMLKTSSTSKVAKPYLDQTLIIFFPSKGVHAQIIDIDTLIKKQKNRLATTQICEATTESIKERRLPKKKTSISTQLQAYPSFPSSPSLMYTSHETSGILNSINVKPIAYRTSTTAKELIYRFYNKAIYNKHLAEQSMNSYSEILSHRIKPPPPCL